MQSQARIHDFTTTETQSSHREEEEGSGACTNHQTWYGQGCPFHKIVNINLLNARIFLRIFKENSGIYLYDEGHGKML